jgi:hypothetical protein
VSRAASSGWTATRMIDLLGSLQGHNLDSRIARQIKIWGGHYGNAAIEKVTLLQVKSPQILQELVQDADIGPLIRPFSPLSAVAIVRDDDVPRLRELLRARNVELSDRLGAR